MDTFMLLKINRSISWNENLVSNTNSLAESFASKIFSNETKRSVPDTLNKTKLFPYKCSIWISHKKITSLISPSILITSSTFASEKLLRNLFLMTYEDESSYLRAIT